MLWSKSLGIASPDYVNAARTTRRTSSTRSTDSSQSPAKSLHPAARFTRIKEARMTLQAKELLDFIGRHGYPLIFFIVLAEAIGLPVPAALALLTAGAACALGILRPDYALLCAVGALLTG